MGHVTIIEIIYVEHNNFVFSNSSSSLNTGCLFMKTTDRLVFLSYFVCLIIITMYHCILIKLYVPLWTLLQAIKPSFQFLAVSEKVVLGLISAFGIFKMPLSQVNAARVIFN